MKRLVVVNEMSDRELALLDWDNTLRPGFTLMDWIEFLSMSNQFNDTTLKKINSLFASYSSGGIGYAEFAEKAPHLYAQGLNGQEVTAVQSAARRFVRADRSRLFAFTWPFLLMLADEEIDTEIISGCPSEILTAYIELLGHGRAHGLATTEEDGFYSGRILINHASSEGKKIAVEEIVDGSPALLAAGDSRSDLPLFDNAAIKLVFGNPQLLSSDPSALHVDPFGPAAQTIELLSSIIRGRSER